MKTKVQSLTKLFLGVLTVGLMASCGNNSSSNQSTPTTPAATTYRMSGGTCYNNAGVVVSTTLCAATTPYYVANGACYSTSTGQPVQNNYCSQVGNTGYTLQNGICYQTSTGQQVPTNYCQNQTGVGLPGSLPGGVGVAQVCVGTYYYQNSPVTCNGTNCSGYTLINANTGQSVMCQ